jgi:hypothetical protein
MARINQSSGQGALFELVARGQKDNYFVKDAKDSVFSYDARYESSAHHLAERRRIVPLTRVTFGNTFEVEIDAYGDVMTECALEVDLPTWLPLLPIKPGEQVTDPSVANNLYSITDSNGVSYGYVNDVGYFLFESIQVYQDQFLLQEWSGDGLLAKQVSEGSWNSSFLQQVNGGQNAGGNSVRSLQMRATPGHLRICLPLPGMQCPGDGGFPLTALPWQSFRIKGKLRMLEDLIVCSVPGTYKPKPWLQSQLHYTFDNGSVYTFAPVPYLDIGQPTLLLSTIQHYVPPRSQAELRSTVIQLPFRRQFENRFTFGELDFIPLDKGGTAAVTRPLDGRHPTERIFWFFRSQNALDSNELDNFYNNFFDVNPPTATQPYTTPYGEFYYQIKLIIAGRDREEIYPALIWESLSQAVKDEKASGKQIGTMNWSTGEKYGTVYPAPREPEGTVNFTTADRPTIYVELANVIKNATLGQRKAEMRLFTEGWNVYVVKEGRGSLMFAN